MVRLPRRFSEITGLNMLLGAVAVGGFAWLAGVGLLQSLLITVILVGMATALFFLPGELRTPWPALPIFRGVGARRDVSRLSWALTPGREGVGSGGILHLRNLAEQRLALRGIALDDRRRVEPLLGADAYSVVLADPDATIRFADFVRSVAALESLDRIAPVAYVPSQKSESSL